MAQRKQSEKRDSNGDPAKRTKAASSAPGVKAPGPSRGGNLTPRLLVGLGASAGGLDAFKSFFADMPPQSGMAFVLVQHLDPHHKSLLVELLSNHTEMPVVQAEDGMAVAADHVFVIPPNAVMTIKGGRLRVSTPAPPREHRKPIDVFFASLAEDQEEKAICIILSGSGSDGSLGLKAVKEHGGFSLAQAGFDETALLGMPSSAAATGLVDEVMPVQQMPERLLAYAQHLGRIGDRKAPDGTRRGGAFDEDLNAAARPAWPRLQPVQGEHPGPAHPAPHASAADRQRARIHRPLAPRAGPARSVVSRPIGVTQFFRDPEAFAALESEAMPKLARRDRRLFQRCDHK
jgi:two-component system, chemotaxis family, CheB/CheR fusion protein